jgi:hypothetical protein
LGEGFRIDMMIPKNIWKMKLVDILPILGGLGAKHSLKKKTWKQAPPEGYVGWLISYVERPIVGVCVKEDEEGRLWASYTIGGGEKEALFNYAELKMNRSNLASAKDGGVLQYLDDDDVEKIRFIETPPFGDIEVVAWKQTLAEFHVGDRVVPISKSFMGPLEKSVVWGSAQRKGQNFLYVRNVLRDDEDWGDVLGNHPGLVYECSVAYPNYGGDYFLPQDLKPYIGVESSLKNKSWRQVPEWYPGNEFRDRVKVGDVIKFQRSGCPTDTYSVGVVSSFTEDTFRLTPWFFTVGGNPTKYLGGGLWYFCDVGKFQFSKLPTIATEASVSLAWKQTPTFKVGDRVEARTKSIGLPAKLDLPAMGTIQNIFNTKQELSNNSYLVIRGYFRLEEPPPYIEVKFDNGYEGLYSPKDLIKADMDPIAASLKLAWKTHPLEPKKGMIVRMREFPKGVDITDDYYSSIMEHFENGDTGVVVDSKGENWNFNVDFHDPDGESWLFEKKDWSSFEVVSERQASSETVPISKKSIGNINGMDIMLVDGEKVRNQVDVDFTTGGNPAVYEYVPKNELWVEDIMEPSDVAPTIVHEYMEMKRMDQKGEPYEKAHDEVNHYERKLRQQISSGEVVVGSYEDAVGIAQDFIDGLTSSDKSKKLSWKQVPTKLEVGDNVIIRIDRDQFLEYTRDYHEMREEEATQLFSRINGQKGCINSISENGGDWPYGVAFFDDYLENFIGYSSRMGLRRFKYEELEWIPKSESSLKLSWKQTPLSPGENVKQNAKVGQVWLLVLGVGKVSFMVSVEDIYENKIEGHYKIGDSPYGIGTFYFHTISSAELLKDVSESSLKLSWKIQPKTFKVGDKVRPISKSICNPLEESAIWYHAQLTRSPFLYINNIRPIGTLIGHILTEELVYACDYVMTRYESGDFFLARDLELVEDVTASLDLENLKVIYNGMQEFPGRESMPVYTDMVTKSSFVVGDNETLEEALARVRKRFGIDPAASLKLGWKQQTEYSYEEMIGMLKRGQVWKATNSKSKFEYLHVMDPTVVRKGRGAKQIGIFINGGNWEVIPYQRNEDVAKAANVVGIWKYEEPYILMPFSWTKDSTASSKLSWKQAPKEWVAGARVRLLRNFRLAHGSVPAGSEGTLFGDFHPVSSRCVFIVNFDSIHDPHQWNPMYMDEGFPIQKMDLELI